MFGRIGQVRRPVVYTSLKCVFILIVLQVFSLNAQSPTHYVFDGIGSWSNTALWSPSYPGLSVVAFDTVTVTATSVLTLIPNTFIPGVFYNEGEMHASDGTYLAVTGQLVNNGLYEVDTIGSVTEPSFTAIDFVNNGTLLIQGPEMTVIPQGMHIENFENTGVFTESGWVYISTEVNIINNGTINVDTFQMESGYFENNDTLQGRWFAQGPTFGSCTGETNVHVNYGYVDIERGYMPCMRKFENHGVFIMRSGGNIDTLINTNDLDIVIINAINEGPVQFSADVLLNSGHSQFSDGHGSSSLRFNKIINSDTLIIDSALVSLIGGDGEIQNFGYFKFEGDPMMVYGDIQNFGYFDFKGGELMVSHDIVNTGHLNFIGADLTVNHHVLNAGHLNLDRTPLDHTIDSSLTLLNTIDGMIVADTLIDAEITNEGELTIGPPGAILRTDPLRNLGIVQLKISGIGIPGVDSGYQKIRAEGDILLLRSSTLEILIDGYVPAPGDSFTVMQCSNLIGEFGAINLPQLDSCVAWSFSYFPDRLVLSIIGSPDTDMDGTLDCNDHCPNDSLKIDPGICGCGLPDLDSDGDGNPDCFDTDISFARQSNSSLEGVRVSGQNADSTQLWYMGSVTDTDTSVMLMNRQSDHLQFGTDDKLHMTLDADGRLGIGKKPSQYRLEVNGQASKSSPGDWLANSDARLKKNIQPLDGATTMSKLLSLYGVTYEWATSKQYVRPNETQYGLTAQNVQEVYPELVQLGKDGFLLTSYGTFDPMFLAAFKELNDEVVFLRSTISLLKARLDKYEIEMSSSMMSKTGKN